MTRVSDLFARCLENEGVRYVFGVPGEENEELLFSLENSSVRFIPTRHEQGAAFMANVWGRLTGKAGVCLATLGPGATNLITGIADAYLDKSPVVAITGQTGLDRIDRESHQYLDIVNIFRSVTKWNASIQSAEAVPDLIRKAFKTAEMEKPGATHLELSDEMAIRETSAGPLKVVEVPRAAPDPDAVRQAAELIRHSSHPLILSGNGVVRKLASFELRRLAAGRQIPVVHTFMGRGAISDLSENSLFSIGLPFRDIVMDAVDQADLVVCVGYDVAEYDPERWNPAGQKTILHVDFLPAEVYRNYQPAVEVVADISASLEALTAELERGACHYEPNWHLGIRSRILEDIKSYRFEDGEFTIPGALNVLREVMHEEDLLISDVGTHKLWIARNFPVCTPNGCIISNGLASMGIAIPGAVAAWLQNPNRGIVAVMGDGGFLMNSQELETARRLGARFTAIIFNDNDYGQISWKQLRHHDHSTGTRISNPDFVAYVKSFGIEAYRPENAAELRSCLAKAVSGRELCVIEVPVSQKAIYKLAQIHTAEKVYQS